MKFKEENKFDVNLSYLKINLENDVFNIPTCTLLALLLKYVDFS